MIGWTLLIVKAGDHRQPDRAAADHQRHIIRRQPRVLHRVPAHRDRFGQRRLVGGQSVRHFQQQALGERHVLREATGDVVGIADALHGVAGDRHRHRADQCAGLQALLGARAVLDHLAAELVAEHHVARGVHVPATAGAARALDELLGVFRRVQIGAADAAAQRLHQHLAFGRRGIGDRVDDDVAVAKDGGAHGISPACGSSGRQHRANVGQMLAAPEQLVIDDEAGYAEHADWPRPHG